MSAAVALAFGAGLLATVNPCGFALLPSFLSFYLGADENTQTPGGLLARAWQGLTVGLVLSGAFSAVFIITGLVVTAGLRSVLDALPWVAFAVGVTLIVLGAAMVAGRRVSLLAASRLQPGVEQRTGYSRVAAFGVGYALASLSCTLAVFLVVVSQALTVSGVTQTLAVFGAYAAGSASVLLALSVSAALARARSLGPCGGSRRSSTGSPACCSSSRACTSSRTGCPRSATALPTPPEAWPPAPNASRRRSRTSSPRTPPSSPRSSPRCSRSAQS